jgi:predicted ATPase/DNA-binding CsgD family transcriptional regulator
MEAAAKRGWGVGGEAVPNNLPRYLTSFVGRRTDLSALKSLLARCRMVTLTGPGGAGKSRLAAELCRTRLDRWPDGVWWVELAPVDDARQVAGAVVSTLELPGRGPALDVVVAWLAARRALLVLDNCEHLVKACAEFCQAALERCPELTVIATSREALGVPGEAHWPVSSLRASDAVRLFEARAMLVRPGFNVAAPNLDPVTEICERLDRLPLAIELAAARVGMMTEQEILSQLADRFHLLTGGSRTAPERLQAMSAAIDWSYRLLTEDEALLFRRLSVFRGGFTLESAQAVCAEGIVGSVLDLLFGLVHKSMVVVEQTEGSGSRYRLLESQLAYAGDRLRETGELEFMRRRHYEYCLDSLGTKLGPLTLPPPVLGTADFAWIARERDNMWAAAAWARSNADDLGLLLGVRLAQATRRFAPITPRRRLLTDLLDHSPATGMIRTYALLFAAVLAGLQGDDDAEVRAAEAGLALARESREVEAVAYALFCTGNAHAHIQHVDAAAEMYDEASVLLKGSTNRRLVTMVREGEAFLAVERGDCTTARDILVECIATARAEGDVTATVDYLESFAWAQLGLNDHQTAGGSFKEALALSRSFTGIAQIGNCLHGLLCVAADEGDDQRASRLAAAADRIVGEWSVRGEHWKEKQVEERLHRSRTRLGTRKSGGAWKQGWAMTLDQAIDYALGESASETGVEAGPLSGRELEVARLVAAGMTNRQIGERLFISWRTAEGHVERIRNKLGVRSRTEVATWAVERALMTDQVATEPGPSRKKGTRNRPPFPSAMTPGRRIPRCPERVIPSLPPGLSSD